jgi:hypothetical protein
MPRIKYPVEHIITKLREAEVALSKKKKKVSATVLRFRHGVPPPLARVSDVSASH